MSVFKYYDWTKNAAASASANDEKEKTMTYAEYKAKRNSASQNSVSGRTMTYKEYKARQVQKSANWFNSQMEQYIKDYTSFAEGAKKASGEIGYKNAYALRDAQFQAAESVIAKNQALSSFLKQYREVIDPEVYTQLNETLTSSLNSLNDTSNYFSNAAAAVDEFDTEDAYLAAIRAGGYLTKYEGMDHQQRMAQLSGLDADSEEHAWLKNYIDSNMTGADYAQEAQKTQWLIDRYEPLLEEYKRLTSWEQDEKGNARIDYIRSVHGDVSEFEKEIEDLKNQLYDYQNLAKYADLSKNADFEEKSVYQGDGSVLQKQINDQDKSRVMDNAHTIAQYVPLDPTIHTYSLIQQLWNYENTHLMKEDEVKNFNYLYNTQGKAAAKEYMDYLQYTLNRRSQENTAKKVAELTSSVPVLSQIVASMASTPLTLAGGTGILDASAQKLIKGITGDDTPVDYNRDAMFASNISNTIRGTVSKDLTNALGDGWGEAASSAYQMGMSMQDSAAVAALSTINPALGTVGSALLAGNAATTTMQQAVENGASDGQAITLGLLSGAWEFIFEKYELDSLMSGGKNIFVSMLKSQLSEGVGEAATELANIASEVYILAENSGWEKNVQAYKQAYMAKNPSCSEAEAEQWARENAFKDAGWQVIEAFAGGFLTGGIMGAGMHGLQSSIANQKAGNNALDNPGGVAALIQAAKDTGLETSGRQQAALERLSGKVSGEIASGTGFKGIAANVRNAINAQRVGKLYNQTVRSNSSLNVADMTAKLQEQGYAKREAASIAEAVDDAMWGRELTDRQNNLLENAMQDPRYQQAIEAALLDKDSQVMNRFMRPEQAFAKHNVQAEAPVAAQETAVPALSTESEGKGVTDTPTSVGGVTEENTVADSGSVVDFGDVFSAVQTAKDNGSISSAMYDQLMDSIQNAVTDYEAGNIDAATYNSLMQSAIDQAGTASRTVQDGTYSARNNDLQVHVDDQTWQQGQKLAKALHRDIVFYNGRKGENGRHVGGTIYVNVNSDMPLMQVVCHELTHSLQGTKAYKQLLNYVMRQYRKNGYDIAKVRAAKVALYKRYDVNLKTQAEVDQEIVAEYMEKHLLADEQSILELVREEPNVAKRILGWIKGMWKRLTAAGDAKTIAQMEWAQRIYSKALSQSLKALPNEGQVTTGKSPAQVKADDVRRGRQQVSDAYRRGELTDEQHDAAMDEYDRAEEDQLGELVGEYSFSEAQAKSADPVTYDDSGNVIPLSERFNQGNDDVRYSFSDAILEDSLGNALSVEQQEYFSQSAARDAFGRLLVLYHQTDGEFTIFDPRHLGAGATDNGTPFGIFLKRSSRDIGLSGKKQMALYVNIVNPLRVANREELNLKLRAISESYADISDQHERLDAEYREKFEQAKKAWVEYISEWRAANPRAPRNALSNDPKFNELYDAEDNIVDEWTAEADRLSIQAKEAITEDLRKAGYDGIFLAEDVGSWGRKTDAIIALDPNQVKNVTNKKPTKDPDIRYSFSSDGDAAGAQKNTADSGGEISFRDELSAVKYNRLLMKKKIKVSRQEWEMIKSQRKSKYSNIPEGDIPVIDFFSIGDYRNINTAYIYCVRNGGADDFSIVMRKMVIPDAKKVSSEVINNEDRINNAGTDSSVAREKGKRGSDRSDSEYIRNGRQLSEDDEGVVRYAQAQRDMPPGNGDADSRAAVSSSEEFTDSQFSISSDVGSMQVELQRLKSQREAILEADPTYRQAEEALRYANTFREKVEARKAVNAAASNIDTTELDQRITDLQEGIRYAMDSDRRHHREDQEKYSGTKTKGYSQLPDTRLKDIDREYIEAVRNGDQALIELLVARAAEAAMPNSVVRDDSGKLLKVYHYTNGRFTVFDRSMARTGTEMDGFFFAPDSISTQEYGGRAVVAYLNITKLAYDPTLDRKFNDSGTLLREKLAYQGYDGVARTEDGRIYEYMAFDPEQIKSAEPIVYDDAGNVIPLSERFNFTNDDIRYSFSDDVVEEDQRTGQGWYDTDEKQLQAKKKGYPVLHGEQVVPFNTWVQTKDRGNYGLVTGLAPGNKLLVNFHNKHEDAAAEVAIPYDNLVPVPGAYQMTKEEFNSLMASEPLDVSSMELTEADEKALEEMYQRSGGEKSDMPTVDIEKMPRKAKDYLRRAENRLLRDLASRLGVSKFVDRTYLKEIVDEIANAYLTEGTVSNELISQLFDKAYDQGVIVDKSFYEQYKRIKDVLRTTAVTLSEQDRADIADFSDFRKRQFNRLRIVDKGGTPVNEFYEELHDMAPELFPESITHPADQLVQMAEVSRSIAVSERLLSEYYGKDAQMYRAWARNEFDSLVGQAMGDLFAIRRFAAERASKAAKEKAPTTPQEAMEVYKKLKNSRRVYERATARNLLTDHDEMMVGRLLRHEMELSHLDPERDNVKGITEVFEAKREYEEYCRLIRDYKKQLSKERRSQADRYLENAHLWKDKKMGIAYSRETMRRNIYDIVPDKNLAREINEVFFEPVHDSEAAATRMKNRYRKRVESLGLSRKVAKGNLVSEAHAVQLLGEAEDNIRMLENAKGRMQHRDGKTLAEWRGVVLELWKSNPNLDEARIRNGVAEFREIYDELFEQMNLIRVENGYEPISYRSGYFPHFQPDQADGILAQFGRALGIETQVVQLPTTISGLTHTFKPGIQWFGNAMERLGFNTAYDAVEGFDKYIEGAASVIHQTANIQNLRALATQIRYRTSQEGIQEQVDAVREDDRLSEDEKQIKIKDILEHGKYELAHFVAELDEYTNLLANKKSKYDRGVEAMMGRRIYGFMKWWESRTAANMIAGNINSALTNFIPLVQAAPQLNPNAMLRGMWDTLKSMRTDDGLRDMSTFLTNRHGSDPLIRTVAERISAGMAIPMDFIDGFVSGSVVRAAYYHNLKRGMSESEAMHQADIFAAGVIADRSKGSTPTLFQATNPVIKLFTQFQLEVNNQFSEVFKDIPRRYRDESILKLGWVLFAYFFGALVFNDLFEFLFGRRPALDPFGLLIDAGRDFADPDVSFAKGAGKLVKNATGQLPFSSAFSLVGFETDGGRVPVSSSVPDLTAIAKAATAKKWDPEEGTGMHWKKRLQEIGDEVYKPAAYVLSPFGGNQTTKIWKGVAALIQGGSYSVDNSGEGVLQYNVNSDPFSVLRAAILGKSSLPQAQEWVESGFDSLSAKETAVYQDMIDVGTSGDDAYRFIQELGKAKETEEMTKDAVKRQMIRDSDVSGDAKAIAYYGLLAKHDEEQKSMTEREIMDGLAEMGADAWEVTKVLMASKDANKLEGIDEGIAKRNAIAESALTHEEKVFLYRELVSEGRSEDIDIFRDAGLEFDQFVKIHNQYVRINDMDESASIKATLLARWVDGQDYTPAQKQLVKDEFAYYSMVPATAAKYDKFVAAGMDNDEAVELIEDLAALEPAEDEIQVKDIQRWRTCVDFSSNIATQLAALRGSMDDKQYAKVDVAYDNNISPEMYVTFRETLKKHDADDSGSLSNKEVEKAVRSMGGLTNKQRAVLWQLAVSSKSAKNNPFSTSAGENVLKALQKDDS